MRRLLLALPKQHKPAFNFAIARLLQATLTSHRAWNNRANLSRGMRFVRSFTNFSRENRRCEPKAWLFPRMRRRWIRCVLSYPPFFVSLFAWFAPRLYSPGGSIDPTSRHRGRRYKRLYKKKRPRGEDSPRSRAVVPFDSIIIIGLVVKKKKKKGPAGILISRETMQLRENGGRCTPSRLSSSSSTFVNSVLSSREIPPGEKICAWLIAEYS